MIDIMDNIDPINYIITDVLSKINGLELVPRNNYIVLDGYSLDVMEIRKNSYRLKLRTHLLQDLCNINIDKKTLVIRYSPKFFLLKTGDEFSTNLFDDTFVLDELQNTFIQNDTVFGLGVEFDYTQMVETIKVCTRVHHEFLQKISAS